MARVGRCALPSSKQNANGRLEFYKPASGLLAIVTIESFEEVLSREEG